MHWETELKFVGEESAIAQLLQSKLLLEAAGNRRARTVEQQAIYFDTDGQALWNAGYILRVRKEGSGYFQTLKKVICNELATRPEFKSEVGTATPDIGSIPDRDTRSKISHILKGQELSPVFEIATRRTKLLLSPKKGVEIEAAFDSGMLSLSGKDKQASYPIHEFELELLKGDVEDLFALARKLTGGLPLALSLSAKAERGYALLRHQIYAPVRSQPICLPAGTNADDALNVILANCLQQFLGNARSVIVANDAEGVHQMRVALRRLRSATSMLDDAQQELISSQIERARHFAGVLGDARNYDVLLNDIIQPVVNGIGSEKEFKPLIEAVLAKRRESWALLLEELRAEAFRTFVLEWAALTYGRPKPVEDTSPPLAGLDVAKFAKQQIKHRAHQIAKIASRKHDPDIDELHDLRLKLKKLRYTIEAFESMFSRKAVRRVAQQLAKLQRLLGDINDIAHSQNLIHRILLDAKSSPLSDALAYAGGLVVGWHTKRGSDNVRSVRKQLKGLSDTKSVLRGLLKRSAKDAGVPRD